VANCVGADVVSSSSRYEGCGLALLLTGGVSRANKALQQNRDDVLRY
jgi:hypothetical protein